MKLNFIHTADWHLANSNRIDDFENSINQIVKFAKEKEVNFILNGSDIFCKRTPDNQSRVVFYRFINSIFPIPMYTTIGNHDSDKYSSLSPLQSLAVDNLIIYDVLGIGSFDVYPDGSHKVSVGILSIPYLIDRPTEKDILDEVDELISSTYDYKIILGHCSVVGASTSSYKVEDTGFNKDFVIRQDVLDKEGINYIALGHIHRQQEIGNIRYSGSIEHVNFGEKDNVVGFYFIEYDTETKKQEVSFIKLDVRPMVELNVDSADNLFNKIDSLPAKSVVKINFSNVNKTVFPLSEVKKKLESLGHTMQVVNFVKEKVSDTGHRVIGSGNKTWKDFVAEEIDGSEGYDKERLKDMFKGYVDENT